MNNIIITKILATTIQIVGNKSKGEGASLANQLTSLGSSESFLKKMIETSFTTQDCKHFTYIGSLDLNPVYQFVSKIFDNHEQMVIQSVNLATYLYEQSINPNIKSGEFYVSLVECEINEEKIEALALLKSERKDTFLTTENDGTVISVKTISGTSLKNLDKGCLILNQRKKDGYVVFSVDKTNSNNDANYWIESFLHLTNCNDEYHETLSIVKACNSFFTKMQKNKNADQTELARAVCRSKELFTQDEKSIDPKTLPKILLKNEEYQKEFEMFLSSHYSSNLPQPFTPQPEVAKKKLARKSNLIYLDKNFEIKLLNAEAKIERGYDKEKDMYYYKLWCTMDN